MTKIVLDLEQLTAERARHEEAIKRIDTVINYYFKDIASTKALNEKDSTSNASVSRMQQAINICEDYLRQGNRVDTIMEFMKLLSARGIKLSRAGVGLAFKKPESNIYFDQENRTWKLKNQG